MDKPRDTLAVVREAREKGIVAIACHPGTKIPIFRWKLYQTLMPALDEQLRWFENPEANVAILTTGMVVYDCEKLEAAELVLAECGDTPHKLLTPRGGLHLGYRRRAGVVLQNKVKIKGLEIDIRTNGGVEMIPPSRTEHGDYRWFDERCGLHAVAGLPCGNVGWTRERPKKTAPSIVVSPELEPDRAKLVRRARAWAACVEGAVSGQRGHDRTYRVCCRLTHLKENCFGLTFEEAWPILCEWNLTCEPLWSEGELRHKLEDAIKKR
jgi:hypothetical protein